MKRSVINLKKVCFKAPLLCMLIMVSSFCFFNCEAAYECLQGLKPPELPTKEFKTGYLNQSYYDELIPYFPKNADVEVFVSDFQIEEQLPEGINAYLNAAKIVFEGVPKQGGIFEFKVVLNIDSENGVSICHSDTVSKDYTIQINN